MASELKWEPPKLDLSVDRLNAFKSWSERFEDFAVVSKLEAETPEYKCSVLRYCFSEDTRCIYNTLTLSEDEKKDYKEIIKKLEEFARGTVNETLERHNFNNRNQEEGESFDDFLTELKVLRKNCNFCPTCSDGLLRDRIVGGTRDAALRQKLLSEDKLTLKKTEDICRSREKAKQGAKLFTNKSDDKTDNEIMELNRRYVSFASRLIDGAQDIAQLLRKFVWHVVSKTM